jgi:hypothetical protein
VAEPVLVFVLAVAMAVVVVVVVVVPVMVPVVVLAGSCGGLAVMLPGRGRVWGRGEGCDLVARGSPCRVPVSQSAAGMRQRDNTLIPTIAACASATPAAATHTNRSYAQHTRSCPHSRSHAHPHSHSHSHSRSHRRRCRHGYSRSTAAA